jgi:signal transduction histidine kinase
LSVLLGGYAWRHRRTPGAVAFAVQMWGLGTWTLACALELASRELATKLFWAKMRYPGTLATVVCWLLVVIEYTGHRHWLTRRTMALLGVVPLLTLVVVFTNDWHHLHWTTSVLDREMPGLEQGHGPWFWVHLAFCYVLLLVSLGLILRTLVVSPATRKQSFVLLVAAILPFAGNVVDTFEIVHLRLDPTPFALLLSGALLAWGLIYLRLLDIIPVARELVIESMSDGMLVLDASGQVADMNPAARQILAADVLGAWPEMLKRFRDVTEADVEVSVAVGGAARRYHLKVSLLHDRSGSPAGRVFVWRDVTARHRAEEERQRLSRAVEEERARLQAVIRSSRDGIVLLGEDRRFLVVNAPALRLLRLPGEPSDWLGREVDAAVALLREATPAVAAALSAAAGGALDAAGEGRFDSPPDSVKWASLPLPAGEVAGRLLLLHDVTDQVAAERLREDLTHAMVHDLRNPLTSMAGALEMLSADPLPERQKDIVSLAHGATERLIALVGSILDVSRLESGELPLDWRPLCLATLVEQTLALAAPLASKKDLRIENLVAPDQPPARADPELLGRVLQNLVGNAVKFTPAGGSVRVSARLRNGQAAMLEVTVSDSGGGVPPEVRERLFQKFAAGRQEERGSGLGLAFCRLAVEAHGGRIWVEGAEGGGASFSFTVPVATVPAEHGAA